MIFNGAKIRLCVGYSYICRSAWKPAVSHQRTFQALVIIPHYYCTCLELENVSDLLDYFISSSPGPFSFFLASLLAAPASNFISDDHMIS